MNSIEFPAGGLLRLRQILGDKKHGIAPLIPVSASTWYAGVASGIYPKPVQIGAQAVAWRSADIQHLINKGIGAAEQGLAA